MICLQYKSGQYMQSRQLYFSAFLAVSTLTSDLGIQVRKKNVTVLQSNKYIYIYWVMDQARGQDGSILAKFVLFVFCFHVILYTWLSGNWLTSASS